MTVKQVYELVNNAAKEAMGEVDILQEDLTGVVDLGEAIYNVNKIDNYVKSLVDQIGKMVFVSRPYMGSVPSVLKEAWEFGSIMMKVSGSLYEATENESWELTDQQTYEENTFYKPTATVKFFNSKTTFEIPISITERQVKESFQSATQLNSFISMIYNDIETSMTVKTDELIMRVLNNMTAETLYNDYYNEDESKLDDFDSKTGVRAVNLLKMYNDNHTTQIEDFEHAIINPEFQRYAIYMINKITKRLTKINKIYNIGNQPRFTPSDKLSKVFLSDFIEAAKVFLYDANGQLKDSNLQMSNYETVPFWQASGDDYGLGTISEIHVKNSAGHEIECSGIIGIVFDERACAVCNTDSRITSKYNAKAEFTNFWHKKDMSMINDTNEQFIVFFAA